jgi:hypothetical protein
MKFNDLLVISILTLPLTLAGCDKNEDDDAASDEAATSDEATSDAATSEGNTTAETSGAEGTTTAAEEGTTVAEEGTTVAEEGTTAAESTTDGTTGEGVLTWYSTCGDPVCSGYDGPWEGVPACGDISEGEPCSNEGETCDFMSDCNAQLICATKDPKMGEGGCPISRSEFKQDIAYLDSNERDAFYEQLLDMRMSTWRYKARADGKTHLGVILEDGEDQVWADPANDRVDLYSYGSLAIVGVQKQAGDIAELEAAVAALQLQVEALREQAERCK